MKKICVLLFLMISINIYGQYSVVENDVKIRDYILNGSSTALPVFARISTDTKSLAVNITRKGRKTFTININNSENGWVINKQLTIPSGNALGLGCDFATGRIYVLPNELLERVSKTLTKADMINLTTSENDNTKDLGVLLVDAGALRRERLDRFVLLIDEKEPVDSEMKYTPKKAEKIEKEDYTKGIMIPDRPLITAAANGQFDAAKKLLDNGENINETDPSNGDNALMKAVRAGDNTLPAYLINNGINAKHKNKYGQNAVHIAGEAGNYDIVQRLISADVNINDKDNNGNTPLMYAAISPNNKIVELMLKNGARVNEKNNDDMTALAFAAANGNTKTTKTLLEKNADPKVVDKNGNTILMQAVKAGHGQIVKELINAGAQDLDYKDINGDTPLHLAIVNGNTDLVRNLLELGADINAKNKSGDTPLILAIKNKDDNITGEILKKSPDLYATNNDGQTAYDIAAVNGSGAMADLTSAIKATDAMASNLFNIVIAGESERVRELLKRGVKVDIVDLETGNTPIFTAVANNNKEMTELLMNAGANLNWQNKRGNTPLIVAVSAGDEQMVKLLLDNKADPNIQNINGDTPILWATKLKKTGMIQYLLLGGANANIKNYAGITPLSLAIGEGDKELEKLLRSFGAY